MIDLEEVKRAKARQANPHLEKYSHKLKELLQSKISLKDNFMNLIAGLSSGTLLFVAAQIKGIADNGKRILYAELYLFFAIISVIFFKIFLNVIYDPLRLEVKLTRLFWEKYEFERAADEEKKENGEVCKKTNEKLRRNKEEREKILNPKHKEKTVKWSIVRHTFLNLFYVLAIVLFILGYISMRVSYFSKCNVAKSI